MKICLLNLDYKPFRTAGLTVYGELLAEGLRDAHHEVTVVAARRQHAPREEMIDGVRVFRVSIGPTDWFGFGVQAARLLNTLQPAEGFDVVHFLHERFAWAYQGSCVASLFESFGQRLRARGGMPYYHNLPNLVFRYTYFLLVNLTLQRWAASRPKVMIAASQAARNEFIRHYGIEPDRIHVVPLGINTDHYHPRDSSELQRALGLEGKRVILYVGFSTPRKGLEILPEALNQLGPDCRLLLVGKWEPGYRKKFRQSLTPHIRTRVLEVGYVPDEDLPVYYSMADVFVFPSLLEGFGLPVVEAMACATPVIAASTSSLPEVVGDAGLLVPAMDSTALAEALQQILSDVELRHTLAERSLERARRLYSKESMVARTLEVYQTYLAQK